MPPMGDSKDATALTSEVRALREALTSLSASLGTKADAKGGGFAGTMGKDPSSVMNTIAAAWDKAGKNLVSKVDKSSTEIGKAYADAAMASRKARGAIEVAGTDLAEGLKTVTKKLSDASKGGGTEITSAMQNIIGMLAKFKKVGDDVGALADIVSFVIDVFTNPLRALGKALMAVASVAINAITAAEKKIGVAFSGVEALMGSLNEEFTAIAKKLGGDALGELAGTMMANAIKGIMFDFEDSLAKRKMRYAEAAQLGTGAKGGTAGDAAGMFNAMGRERAQQWQGALVQVGVTQKGILGEMVRTGMTMGMDAGKTASMMDRVLVSVRGTREASTQMRDNFRMMQASAAGTTVPVQMLAEAVVDASSNARFLNVDMVTVGKTMQMLMSDQEKFEATGLSMRTDSKKVLNDMATAGDKATDALHAFYGTKGGAEGSPIEGLIKSKFGTQFLSTLKTSGTGGFTATGGKSGDMMVQRLDVMKTTMMESAKGGKTDSEKLYLQMKVATDVFGMSQETAQYMGMMSKDKLDQLAKDPKFADQFKSTNQILSDMKGIDAINEQMARAATKLSLEQLAVGLKMLKIAELQLRGILADDTEKKKIKKEMEDTDIGGSFELMKTSFVGILDSMGTVWKGSEQGGNIVNEIKKILHGGYLSAEEEKAGMSAEDKKFSEDAANRVTGGIPGLQDKDTGGSFSGLGISNIEEIFASNRGSGVFFPGVRDLTAVPLDKFLHGITGGGGGKPGNTFNVGVVNVSASNPKQFAEELNSWATQRIYS
jgi:hypothetical protein